MHSDLSISINLFGSNHQQISNHATEKKTHKNRVYFFPRTSEITMRFPSKTVCLFQMSLASTMFLNYIIFQKSIICRTSSFVRYWQNIVGCTEKCLPTPPEPGFISESHKTCLPSFCIQFKHRLFRRIHVKFKYYKFFQNIFCQVLNNLIICFPAASRRQSRLDFQDAVDQRQCFLTLQGTKEIRVFLESLSTNNCVIQSTITSWGPVLWVIDQWSLTFFTYPTLSSNKITGFTPQAQYTHWCSFIENTKLTNFYSLEWFITFTFVAIYGSVNLSPWKMKFTPRGKFTPRLRTTVIDGNVFVSTEKKLVISVRMSENIGQWTLLWRVLIQLWNKWPKCVSDQNFPARQKQLRFYSCLEGQIGVVMHSKYFWIVIYRKLVDVFLVFTQKVKTGSKINSRLRKFVVGMQGLLVEEPAKSVWIHQKWTSIGWTQVHQKFFFQFRLSNHSTILATWKTGFPRKRRYKHAQHTSKMRCCLPNPMMSSRTF